MNFDTFSIDVLKRNGIIVILRKSSPQNVLQKEERPLKLILSEKIDKCINTLLSNSKFLMYLDR